MVLAESDPEEAFRLAGRAGSLASLARPKALIAATEAAVRTGDLPSPRHAPRRPAPRPGTTATGRRWPRPWSCGPR